MQKGDKVYSIRGTEAEFVSEFNSKFLVNVIYEGEDGEFCSSRIETWDEIFFTPPVEKLHKEVEELNNNLQLLRNELILVKKDRQEHDSTLRQRINELKQYEQLEYLEKFLKNEVTHYVIYTYGYSIVDLKDTVSEYCDDYKKEFKLLTLFGSTNGDLQWKLNYYRDGSGGWDVVVPCFSFEEAKETLKKMIDEVFNLWRIDNKNCRQLSYAVEACKKYKFEIPEDVFLFVQKTKKQSIQKQIDEINLKLQETMSELEKV